MKRKIKIGLDFDGVVAYNPFRIARYPIAYFKRRLLGIRKLSFFYPKSNWQKTLWILIHESSIFPAKGIDLFTKMVEGRQIEAHLVTARFSFLDKNLYKWLKKHELTDYFKSININNKNEQPHIFKEKMLRKIKPDYFIEDNLDIVKYLCKKQNSRFRSGQAKNRQQKIKIYWIYNLMDRNVKYRHKYPYLKKALQEIIKKK